MPILPPRNMPLSPRGADGNSNDNSNKSSGRSTSSPASSTSRKVSQPLPATPSSSKTVRGGNAVTAIASSSPSPLRNSPGPASAAGLAASHDGSGQLLRNDETTFHRRLRVLLWDHRAAREAWEDMVSIQGAKSVAALARSSAQLDEWLSSGSQDRTAASTLTHVLQLPDEEATARRAEEVARLLRRMDDERDALHVVLSRLDKLTSKLEALSDAAETLLIEATRAKGDTFTFEREAWTTWPMERFVSIVRTLSARFVVQNDHLRLLCSILLGRGCALGASGEVADDEGVRRTNRNDKEDDDDEPDGAKSLDPTANKERALTRQRVLEEWQALPMLRDSIDGSDTVRWFEDVCEVEVARWEER